MTIPQLDARGIKYRFRNTKQYKIAIGINREAIVTIRYHKAIPFTKVIAYVDKNMPWIEEQFLKFYKPSQRYINNAKYWYLGQEYILNIVKSSDNKVFTEAPYLSIYCENQSEEAVKTVLNKFLDNERENIFHMLLQTCFAKMQDDLPKYPTLQIKGYKSRWGCCYPKRNLIILNKSLIHVPIYLIEYVIFHELAHLKYLDHQEHFHNLLAKYVPNEKALRQELNHYSPTDD